MTREQGTHPSSDPGAECSNRAAERPHEGIYRRHPPGNAPDSPVAQADDYVTKVSDEGPLERSLRCFEAVGC